MTPKEKAQELYDRFNLPTGLMSQEVRECAQICVDEVLRSIIKIQNDMTWSERKQVIERNTGVNYWNDVKKELKKL